jgi:hypothetical protein
MRIVKRKAPWHGFDSTARKNPSNVMIIQPKSIQGGIKRKREYLKQWADEIHEMRLVVRKTLFVELPTVEAEDKHTQSTFEGIRATRETTRLASQACKIVT